MKLSRVIGCRVKQLKSIMNNLQYKLIQVFVRLPLTVNTRSESIKGVIVANMTNWRNVYGNMTLRLDYASHDAEDLPKDYELAHEEFIIDVCISDTYTFLI